MDPAALIEACARLSKGDRSGKATALLSSSVEQEMTVRYAMPFPEHVEATFSGRGVHSRTRRGQWHELVQHLTDLAYLTPADFQSWHAARAANEEPTADLLGKVVAGVAGFVGEDDFPDFRMVPPPPTGSLSQRVRWTEDMLSPVVYRLAGYTNFDGDLEPRPDYRIGERSAYGRSLAFRLRVFFADYRGAHTDRQAPYFTHDHLPLVYLLDNALGNWYRDLLPGRDAAYLHVNFQALLLDGSLIFGAYRRANRFLPDSPGRYYLQYRLPDTDPDPADEVTRREERLSRRADRHIERNELHEDTGTNRLGVRLLQLGLWRAGFYTGVLDGAFGILSHRAVLALVDQEREAGEWKDRRLDRVVVRAAEGVSWLVDLKLVGRLLDRYAPPPAEETEREEAALWEDIRAAGREQDLDRDFADRQREVKAAYGDPQQHKWRRVYYGVRSLVRGAFRAVGRVIAWIARRALDVLGAVFDFVKVVARRLQEGMGLFFSGFRYFGHLLLGRPFVTLGAPVAGRVPAMVTRYALDFDVVNVADAAVTGEDLALHGAELARITAGAAYFLELVAGAVRLIGSLQPPLGWIRLGVYVARWVRERFRGRADREAFA